MARTINEETALDISGSFTGTGTSDENYAADGDFNLSISLTSGTFDATVALERSFDEKATWVTVEEFTAITEKTGTCSVKNPQGNPVAYRLNCSAYVSGTIAFVLNQ